MGVGCQKIYAQGEILNNFQQTVKISKLKISRSYSAKLPIKDRRNIKVPSLIKSRKDAKIKSR